MGEVWGRGLRDHRVPSFPSSLGGVPLDPCQKTYPARGNVSSRSSGFTLLGENIPPLEALRRALARNHRGNVRITDEARWILEFLDNPPQGVCRKTEALSLKPCRLFGKCGGMAGGWGEVMAEKVWLGWNLGGMNLFPRRREVSARCFPP